MIGPINQELKRDGDCAQGLQRVRSSAAYEASPVMHCDPEDPVREIKLSD